MSKAKAKAKEAETEVDEFDEVEETTEETTDEASAEEVEEKPAKKPAKKAAKKAEKAAGDTYTYIGGGASSPRKIMFMGRQEFVRGKPTKVTDPEVLKKVQDNPSFTQGKVSEEDLHDIDEAGAKAEEEQQAINKKIDDSFKKKHG
jgi:hypothetical protein